MESIHVRLPDVERASPSSPQKKRPETEESTPNACGRLGTTPDDEEQLVARATSGDVRALEGLLLDYYSPLSSHIRARIPRSLQGVLDAEDILQQTFVQAFRDIHTFRPQGRSSFRAWLTVIADNRLADARKALQRKKRGGQARRVSLAGRDSSATALVEVLSDGGPTPSGNVARAEAVQAVEVAVAGLPADLREAIRLRYLEQKSLGDAARIMQRSPDAVRGLLDRAKKKLRAALGRMSLYLSRR